MTTDMNVFPVGSFVGHAMIMHKELKRMLAIKRHNLSMNHRKLINWILRQPSTQQAILIPMKQGNNEESLNNCLQSIGGTPIKTHSMAKHRRVSYVNEKLQRSVGCLKRSFAAAVGVEENSLMVENEKCSRRPVTSEEIKTKASDLDKLTEQMREKLTLGSTTSEEKMKILTLTPESWSIVEAASFFGVSEYLIRQARELT